MQEASRKRPWAIPLGSPVQQTLLHAPEYLALLLIIALMAIFCMLTSLWDQSVAWGDYFTRIGAALVVGALGVAYRAWNRSEGIALALVSTGLFIGFTNTIVPLNYLFFPLSSPLIDAHLFQIDALVGYHWPDFVRWLADRPGVSLALALVYSSSAFQLFGLIVFLGFTQRHETLYRYLWTGILTGVITIGFWCLAPSFGPSAYFDLSPEIQQKASLVVTTSYGQELMQLAKEGLPVMRAAEFVGVVAFPSYHTVMAILVVWFCRTTILFFPSLVLNCFMVPAILAHGGHHLIDLVGGILVFGLALFVVNRSFGARTGTSH